MRDYNWTSLGGGGTLRFLLPIPGGVMILHTEVISITIIFNSIGRDTQVRRAPSRKYIVSYVNKDAGAPRILTRILAKGCILQEGENARNS